jgi:bifunctional non-homologous end joining protein LigD
MHLVGGADVRSRMIDAPVLYLLFDVLWLDGEWLTDRPLAARRVVLDELLDGRTGASWQVSAVQVGDGSSLVAATRQIGLEGVVAKRLDSTYELGRRSRAWIKVNSCRTTTRYSSSRRSPSRRAWASRIAMPR